MGFDNRQLWQILNSRIQAVDFAGLASKALRWMAEKAGEDEEEINFFAYCVIILFNLTSSDTISSSNETIKLIYSAISSGFMNVL